MSRVYYIRSGSDGLIKIGKAIDPGQRLRQLQTGNSETLTLVATEAGGVGVERMRHRQFRALRVRGEWFRAEPELLLHIEALRAGRDPSLPRELGRVVGRAIGRCLAGVPALCAGALAGWSGNARVPSAYAAGRSVGGRIRSWMVRASTLASAASRSRRRA